SPPRLSAGDDLGLDLDREIKWKTRDADRGPRMAASLGTIQFQNQISEAIDHQRILVEPVPGIHHAEDPQPADDSVEISEFRLQARQDRERREPGRLISLLHRQALAHPRRRT